MRRSVVPALLLASATLLSAPPSAATSIVLVTNDPFIGADADLYTIQNSVGDIDRHQAAFAAPALARGLHLLPNVQPAAGSVILACVAVDGLDSGLCVQYTADDWPGAKGNLTAEVPVPAGAALSVHFRETGGVLSTANVRASLELVALPDAIFADGFEAPSATTALGGTGTATRTALVTGEPFLFSSAESWTIGGSNGMENRNRAAVPSAATATRLVVLPNQQPLAGALIEACLSVNGTDAALCTSYDSTDWPGARVGSGAVALAQGDALSVHFTEVNGQNAGVNVRATLEMAVPEGEGAVVVTEEPFLAAGGDLYSIGGGSSGTLERNRAAAPRAGTIANLVLLPSDPPQAGSVVEACINVNGTDVPPCVTYTSADWPGAKVNSVDTAAIAAGDEVSVHFTETNAVSSGANVRASFSFR